jgi:hypothetical protein
MYPDHPDWPPSGPPFSGSAPPAGQPSGQPAIGQPAAQLPVPVPRQYTVPYGVQPYPPAYPPPVLVVQVQPPQTSGLAVASLVLGILGVVSSCCSFGIFSILAIIFGHVGLVETRRGAKAGQGMAVAGLVLGYVVFLPAVLFSIFFLVGGGLAAVTAHPTPTP